MKVMSRAPGLAAAVIGLLAASSAASCTTFGAEAGGGDAGPDAGSLPEGGTAPDSETPLQPEPELLLGTLTKPWYLAKDGDVLWVSSYNDAGLWRVSATKTFAPSQVSDDTTFGVAFDSDYVYGCASTRKRLVRRLKTLAQPAEDVDTGGCLEVVVAGTTIFVSGDTGVKRIPRGAFGSPNEFSDIKMAEGLAADTKNLFVAVLNGGKAGAPNGLYAKALDEPTVQTKITITTQQARRIALDATHVYWVDYGEPTVRRAPKPSGTVQTLGKGLGSPGEGGIAVDATHVYWVLTERGEIVRTPKAGGGEIEPVVQGRKRPIDLVVDATHVYFTEEAANAVVRIPKPPPK